MGSVTRRDHRSAVPETLRDGRWFDGRGPPTIGAKIVPSRDHAHLIDGSLSVDSFRVGRMAATAALGQILTHAVQQFAKSQLATGQHHIGGRYPT